MDDVKPQLPLFDMGGVGEPIPELNMRPPETDEDLSFHVTATGLEYLRFTPDGKVFVLGDLVDDKAKVYEAFKTWMAACQCVDCGKKII